MSTHTPMSGYLPAKPCDVMATLTKMECRLEPKNGVPERIEILAVQAVVRELIFALREICDDHGKLCQRIGLSENEAGISAALNHKAHTILAKASA